MATRRLSARGSLLLEQVVGIGLLGLLLLMVAATQVRTGQGARKHQRAYEAANVANNRLEEQLTKAVDRIPLGAQPAQSGQFQDGSPYSWCLEGYSLAGQGPAAGLTDSDIRGVRIRVIWNDPQGLQSAQAEGYVVRIPQ